LGNGIRVLDQTGIPVGKFFNLICKHLSIFISDNLHQGRSNVSQIVKASLL